MHLRRCGQGRVLAVHSRVGHSDRVHWTSVEDQTEPFDEGWLLQSETVDPLDDVSGWACSLP